MTKEQLTAWIVANLTLSRTDLKFFSFVAGKAAAQQPITTAQDALWHQLLRKYYRQLRKTFADDKIKQVECASWQHAPIQTVRFNKLGVADINNVAYLTLKTPYNKTINSRIQTSLLHHTLRYSSSLGWHFLFSHQAVGDLLKFATTVLGRNNFTLEPLLAEYVSQVKSLGTREQWMPTVRIVFGRAMVSAIAETMLPHLPAVDDWSVVAIKQYADMGIKLHPFLRRAARTKYGRHLVELSRIQQPVLSVKAASMAQVCDVIYNYTQAHRTGCVAICTGSLYSDTVLDAVYYSLTARLEMVNVQVLVGLRGVDEPAPDIILTSTLMHCAHYASMYPTAKIIIVSNTTSSLRFISS